MEEATRIRQTLAAAPPRRSSNDAAAESPTTASTEPTDDPTDEPTEEPSESAEPPDTSPEAARAAYAEALRALVSADTGHVKASAALSVDLGVSVDSDYQISTISSRGAIRAGGIPGASEAERVTAQSTWAGNNGWYRRTDDSGAPVDQCWTRVSPDDPLPPGDLIRAAPLGFPAALDVLESGRGLLRTGSEIRVQVDLFRLALVFGPAVAAYLGLDHEGQGVGSIIVIVTDGQIASWRTSSGDFLRAAEEAGIELREFADYLSGPQSLLSAEFTEPGQAVDLAAPPAAERCAS